MRIFLPVFLISFVLFNIATPNISCEGEKPIDVKFCDLVNSTQYQNIEVRVKALYRSGFECSELFSSKCSDSGYSVWLSLPNENPDCYLPLLHLQKNSFGRQTIGLIVVGKMSSHGQYGHLDAYDYEFAAKYIEKAEILYEEDFLNKNDISDNERHKIEKEWEDSP